MMSCNIFCPIAVDEVPVDYSHFLTVRFSVH